MEDEGPLPALTPTQLEVMDVVWEHGEVTVADVWKALSSRRVVARNTVLTLLTRLEEKGWLERDSTGHAHRYRATAHRDATRANLIDRLLETAFGGSIEGLVMALLQGRGISKEEAARLRALIDQAEKQRRKRP
jgi:predicted transcriptional regulator